MAAIHGVQRGVMSELSNPRISRVKTRGRPFRKGNPGRPKGARNKAKTMLESMFHGEAAKIGRKAIELAKEGRFDAIKLVLDRAYPSRNCRAIDGVSLPPIKTLDDAVTAMGMIAQAASAGAITIEEARALSEIIESFRKTHELADIERRLAALEKGTAHGAPVETD
jgi:hypothetical protein